MLVSFCSSWLTSFQSRMLKPKWNIHLLSHNFFFANHTSTRALNMVIEVPFTFANSCLNNCGSVGSKNIPLAKTKSLPFLWPFLPYLGLGYRCWKKEKKKSQFIAIIVESGISIPIPRTHWFWAEISLFVILKLTMDSLEAASWTVTSSSAPSSRILQPAFLQ